MSLIKSISGIRGTIGGRETFNLTPPDIVKFTAGYAQWLTRRIGNGRRCTVIVGRDARVSGPMVNALVTGTLAGCGIDVIDLGLATTPGVEVAVQLKGAQGGIIITASHNPAQWNALKLLNEKGEFVDDEDGRAILGLSESPDREYPAYDKLGSIERYADFGKEHIKAVLDLPLVDAAAIRARKFKIVVDAVNSVGGIEIPELLRALGAEVIGVNCEPTGLFAHNPEPLAANLTELSERVVSEGADLGISVDPDVDRLALVCEDGKMFGEEYTLVAVADYVLSRTPGDTVSNLSSSRALSDVAARYGCGYHAAAVGEVNVVKKMKDTGAVIGGEGNGGVIYPPLHYGRDALVGVALFLTHLARRGVTMTGLRASYPAYSMSKMKADLPEGTDTEGLLQKIAGKYSGERINLEDGVKIDFTDSWVHMRRSNTEPIIRIYSEAADQHKADTLASRFAAEISGLL